MIFERFNQESRIARRHAVRGTSGVPCTGVTVLARRPQATARPPQSRNTLHIPDGPPGTTADVEARE